MKRLFSIITACFLSSCQLPVYLENTSVQPLTIEVLQPASGSLIPPPGKILIFPGNKSETRIYINGAEDTSFRNLGKETLFRITDGVIERLYDSPVHIPVPLPIEKLPGNGKRLSWEQVDALATPDTCTSVLTIDECIAVNEAYVEQSSSFYSLESFYSVIAETEIYVHWTVYDRNKRISEEKDTSIHSRRVSNWYPDPQEAFNELPAPDELLNQVAIDAGSAIASYLSPLWTPAVRYYFSAGSAEMRAAANFIANGEFGKADSIWSILENSRNKGIAYHASYNRIILQEIDGDLSTARENAEKLWKTSRMTEAQKYLELLNRRILEKDLILKQTETN